MGVVERSPCGTGGHGDGACAFTVLYIGTMVGSPLPYMDDDVIAIETLIEAHYSSGVGSSLVDALGMTTEEILEYIEASCLEVER